MNICMLFIRTHGYRMLWNTDVEHWWQNFYKPFLTMVTIVTIVIYL